MNLIDCYVTEVLSLPYEEYGRWWVKVKYDSYGRLSETELMLNTRAEAEAVKVGHHFLS